MVDLYSFHVGKYTKNVQKGSGPWDIFPYNQANTGMGVSAGPPKNREINGGDMYNLYKWPKINKLGLPGVIFRAPESHL